MAADLEPKINVQNQTGRDGRVGRTWAERLQRQDCNQGLQGEHGQTHREGDSREPESLGVLGPLWGPGILFLRGEGAERQAGHSKTGVPTPGMELRELPRWKGGQKLTSEPRSRVSKTQSSSNKDQ